MATTKTQSTENTETTPMTLEEALGRIEILEVQLANALSLIQKHETAEQTKRERRRDRRQIRKAKQKALVAMAKQEGILDDEGNLLIEDDELMDDDLDQ